MAECVMIRKQCFQILESSEKCIIEKQGHCISTISLFTIDYSDIDCIPQGIMERIGNSYIGQKKKKRLTNCL